MYNLSPDKTNSIILKQKHRSQRIGTIRKMIPSFSLSNSAFYDASFGCNPHAFKIYFTDFSLPLLFL